MADSKIEEVDFFPQIPVVRLILICLAYGVLGWAFVNEVRFEFQQASQPTVRDLVETIAIGLLLLASFCFITSFLLLQFRLKFTEAGIRRLTLFGPRFISWRSVQSASLWNYKGYICLELRVSRWRWVCVPLLEFKRGGRLFTEIRSRLHVDVRTSENQLALLDDR